MSGDSSLLFFQFYSIKNIFFLPIVIQKDIFTELNIKTSIKFYEQYI